MVLIFQTAISGFIHTPPPEKSPHNAAGVARCAAWEASLSMTSDGQNGCQVCADPVPGKGCDVRRQRGVPEGNARARLAPYGVLVVMSDPDA